MADRIIRAILTGDSAGLVKAYQTAGDASKVSSEEQSGAFSKLSSAMQNPAVLASAAVVAAGVAIGVASFKSATAYQSSTDRMAAAAGITQAAAKQVGNAFLTTAFSSTVSAKEMMDAYGPVAGQFTAIQGHALSSSQALSVMKTATDLADASGQSLSSTTAALAQVMQAYQIPISGAAAASDTLFNASRATGVPISTLVSTVDNLHAKMGQLAPSLSDVSTLLLDATNHGLTGSRALMLVSSGMTTLLGGAKPVNSEISKLGLHLYNAQGKFIGIGGVIAQLQPKLAGMTDQQKLLAEKTLFGASASLALNSTISGGAAGWATAASAADRLGTAHNAAAVATDNISGAIDRAKSGVSDLMVRIGQLLIPVVTTLINLFNTYVLPALDSFFNTIMVHMPQIEAGFRVFGTIVGDVFSVIFTIIKTEVEIWYTIISSVIERIVAIVQTLVGVFRTVAGGIQSVFTGIGGVIAAAINGVIATAKSIIDGVIGAINTVIGVIDKIQVHIHFGPINMDWSGLNIPQIPVLDMGGIVTGPTLALLSANNVPEAVTPLSGPNAPRGLGGSGGGGSSVPIILNFYGITPQELPNLVVNALTQYERSNGSIPITTKRGIT